MHDISRLLASCYVTLKGKRFPKYHDKDFLIKTNVQSKMFVVLVIGCRTDSDETNECSSAPNLKYLFWQ